MRTLMAGVGAAAALALPVSAQSLGSVTETSVSGAQLRGSADPAYVFDFSVVMLEGGQWTPEIVRAHLKAMDGILRQCGVGIGNVRLVRARSSNRRFTDTGLSCTRFRNSKEREYRCLRGPGSSGSESTVQGLAQSTAAFGRPALHLVDELESTADGGIAYSNHRDQGHTRFWNSPKTLSGAVTAEENRHLRYFNNTLGTAFVAHNLRPDQHQIGGPENIRDSQISVRITHEMAHLLGIPHDETEPPSFMHATPGSSESVNEGLCRKIKDSPLVRRTGAPAAAPAAPVTPVSNVR